MVFFNLSLYVVHVFVYNMWMWACAYTCTLYVWIQTCIQACLCEYRQSEDNLGCQTPVTTLLVRQDLFVVFLCCVLQPASLGILLSPDFISPPKRRDYRHLYSHAWLFIQIPNIQTQFLLLLCQELSPDEPSPWHHLASFWQSSFFICVFILMKF
jgi:hypothetical protein